MRANDSPDLAAGRREFCPALFIRPYAAGARTSPREVRMFRETFKKFARSLGGALFGEKLTCAACGADLFDGGYFCRHCLETLPFNAGFVCSKCGRAVAEDYPVCLECKAHTPSFSRASSAFRYEGDIIRLIKKFKTGGKYLAAVFADCISSRFLSDIQRADFIVCVPMTEAAERRRGYNQSRLLAEEVSRRTGVPFDGEAIVKTRDTSAQKELSLSERSENLKGSFRVRARAACRGKRVAVIDDVLTTGSTADALARALLGAGAAEVNVYTAASVAYRKRAENGKKGV